MTTQNNDNYVLIKPARGGKSMFVNTADDVAMQSVRDRYNNQDLLTSVCCFAGTDISAPRIYPLYFIISANNLEECRIGALGTCSYIEANYGVPEDCLELIYNGGGRPVNGHDDSKNTTDAEMIITVPPIVFGDQPTSLMPVLNYQLARQIAKDGIRNIDIDVHNRDYFIALPNSLNTTTGRFVIPLSIKELLYLDAGAIIELSKKPRPEDSFVMPHLVPEAVEWFAEVLEEQERYHKRQEQLRKRLLGDGWQIPPCIRRLQWADLSENQVLEACRIIARFYPFIHAGEDEV